MVIMAQIHTLLKEFQAVVLFFYQADYDIYQDRQHNRNQNRTRQREIERKAIALNADITGQATKGDAEFGGEKYQSPHYKKDYAPDHQESSDVFHNNYTSRGEACFAPTFL
jgi:hypothetical protein